MQSGGTPALVAESPDLDETIAALRRALDIDDRDAVTRCLEAIEAELSTMNPLVRGMTYAHVKSVMGEPATAVSVVEDLLELMPDDPVVYYQLGCYRRSAGDDEGALAAFCRATELDGSMTDAWLNRGLIFDRRGEPAAAVEAYGQVVLRAPAEVDGWRNLGDSLAAMGHFEQAEQAYRTALSLRPDDPPLLVSMASVHQAQGDLVAANALLSKSGSRDRGSIEEVRVSTDDGELGCRFRAPSTEIAERRQAASALLTAAASMLRDRDADEFPVAYEGSMLVWLEGLVLLCDVDPQRPGLPHRFFDGTHAVARALEGL